MPNISVQGLKKVPVGSYQEIEDRMAEGTANRTVAATKMNATSRYNCNLKGPHFGARCISFLLMPKCYIINDF